MSDDFSPHIPSPEVIREFPDRGTIWLLTDPIQLQHLLQLLAPQLAERLHVAEARRINRSLIPPDLQKTEQDIIFQIPYRTEPQDEEARFVLVYILLEHQSRHDPLMPLRLLSAMVKLWEEEQQRAEEANRARSRIRLSPVIPVVFYTGTDTWETPLLLRNLMDVPDGEMLEAYIPRWNTLFLDLQKTPSEVLTRFSTALGYALRVLQSERTSFAELERVVSEAFVGLEELSEEQVGEWRRVAWFIVLMLYHRRERGEYDRLLDEILEQTRSSKFGVSEEVGGMVQSMAQYVAEQAEARGREEATRAILYRLGTKRFGPESVAIRQKIEAVVSLEQLGSLVDRVYAASSWEELLATLA